MIKHFFRKPKPVPPEPLKATPYEFITWMRYANAGWLMEGNVYSIEWAIGHLPSNKPIIEIGSFCGLSTNLINFYLAKNQRPNNLFCSDKWEFENAGAGGSLMGGSDISFNGYKDFVKSTFRNNVSFFSQNRLHKTYPIEEFSDDFFRLWKEQKPIPDVFGKTITPGGPISFAYIDGNHTYDFAKRDFQNVDALLEPGGFILFDDSGDDSGWEVCRVIDEIKTNPQYEVVFNNPNYLVRKIN